MWQNWAKKSKPLTRDKRAAQVARMAPMIVGLRSLLVGMSLPFGLLGGVPNHPVLAQRDPIRGHPPRSVNHGEAVEFGRALRLEPPDDLTERVGHSG